MSTQGSTAPPPFSLSATRGRWASEGRKSAKQFPELQDMVFECWRTRNVRAPTVHSQTVGSGDKQDPLGLYRGRSQSTRIMAAAGSKHGS